MLVGMKHLRGDAVNGGAMRLESSEPLSHQAMSGICPAAASSEEEKDHLDHNNKSK